MLEFLQGQVVRLSGQVTDITGVLADPSSMVLKVKTPDGITTSYSTTLIHDGSGLYHYDLPLTQAGEHYYRWEATGVDQGAVQDILYVYAASI